MRLPPSLEIYEEVKDEPLTLLVPLKSGQLSLEGMAAKEVKVDHLHLHKIYTCTVLQIIRVNSVSYHRDSP